MSDVRYCPFCDADREPATGGLCSDCGSRMPSVPSSYRPAGATDFLAANGPALTNRQIQMLGVVATHRRVLGAWNDDDLVKLESSGLVAREQIYSSTGRQGVLRIWSVTGRGDSFLIERGGVC